MHCESPPLPPSPKNTRERQNASHMSLDKEAYYLHLFAIRLRNLSFYPAILPATSSNMCIYTDTSQSFSKCTNPDAKHQVGIRLYQLCEKAQPDRRHCSDSTEATDALLGSSRAKGDCPTCKDGTVSVIVSLIPRLLRRAAD